MLEYAMPKWNDIAKLSDREEKTREAAFEAEMLALLATDKPKPSAASSPPPTGPAPAPTIAPRDAVQICVTENGQTAVYALASTPEPVREQIGNAWGLSPRSNVPPVIALVPATAAPATSTPRPRTLRFAMTLNLFVPGAGQFYLGQRTSGLFYAGGFCVCLVTMLVLFVRAYSQYMQLATNGDILEGGNLETLAGAFPVRTLLGLSVVGTLIYIVSAIHLAVARDHQQRPPP
jgi:TM2 domain-containing membrane protein YozV